MRCVVNTVSTRCQNAQLIQGIPANVSCAKFVVVSLWSMASGIKGKQGIAKERPLIKKPFYRGCQFNVTTYSGYSVDHRTEYECLRPVQRPPWRKVLTDLLHFVNMPPVFSPHLTHEALSLVKERCPWCWKALEALLEEQCVPRRGSVNSPSSVAANSLLVVSGCQEKCAIFLVYYLKSPNFLFSIIYIFTKNSITWELQMKNERVYQLLLELFLSKHRFGLPPQHHAIKILNEKAGIRVSVRICKFGACLKNFTPLVMRTLLQHWLNFQCQRGWIETNKDNGRRVKRHSRWQ